MKRPAVAAAVAVTLALSSCGIPSDRTARPLAVADAPPATGSVGGPVAPTSAGTIFLSQGGQLVPVTMPINGTSLGAVVTALLTWSGGGGNLTSAINDRTRLLKWATDDQGVALLSFSAEFADVPSRTERLAVAQVVYTATSVPGISSVRFSVQNTPIEVPTASGRLVSRPVTRDDYADLLAAP
jgi:hypothetical protein